MDKSDAVVLILLNAVLGFVIGVSAVGIPIGRHTENTEVIRQCERSGLYITEGVVVQCPAVLKSKE